VYSDRHQQITDPQDNRQDQLSDRQYDRQDFRQDARENWQDDYDDRKRWDNRATGAAVFAGAAVVGSAISASTYDTLSCTNVFVDGVAQSNSSMPWHKRPLFEYGVVALPPVEKSCGQAKFAGFSS
jgi:hypothetical protein